MDGRAVPEAGQFDSVDQPHPQRLGRGASVIQTVKGIVIGQGQQLDAASVRAFHQHRGRQHAVGRGAVAMQVDIHSVRVLLGGCGTQRVTTLADARALVRVRQIGLGRNGRQDHFATSAVCYYAGHTPPLAPFVKQIIDFVPLLLFFIVYKLEPRAIELAGFNLTLGGIFSATAVLIISS